MSPGRSLPTRSCVACRTARPKIALLRVVRDPAGGISVDPTGRRNGRGAYVCHDQDCMTNAIRKGMLSRALETPVPATLFDELVSRDPELTIQGGPHGQE